MFNRRVRGGGGVFRVDGGIFSKQYIIHGRKLALSSLLNNLTPHNPWFSLFLTTRALLTLSNTNYYPHLSKPINVEPRLPPQAWRNYWTLHWERGTPLRGIFYKGTDDFSDEYMKNLKSSISISTPSKNWDSDCCYFPLSYSRT